MVVISLLEFISIGSIFPLLDVIFSEKLDRTIEKSFLTNFIGLSEESIFILLSLIFITFFLKNIFILFYTKYSSSFMMHLTLDIQRKTFEKYLYSNYEVLRKIDSNEILRDINIESRMIIGQYVSPLLTLILNLLIIFLITVLLFLFNYKVSLLLTISLIILFFLFKLFFSKKLINLGYERQNYTKDILKSIKQTFDGYRELSTYNFLSLFLKIFVKKSVKLANNGMRRSILLIIPKLVLETLVILLITLSIGFMYLYGYKLSEIFLIISIYTIAGLRIFPIFVAITNAYQNLDYSSAAVNKINEILGKKINRKEQIFNDLKYEKTISIEGISYSYDKKQILKNLSLTIPKNSFFGITGPSGCGKSTLVDLISGLTQPTAGSIKIDGTDIRDIRKIWSKKTAYVQQKTFIFDTSLINNITLNNDEEHDPKLLKYALEISHLENFTSHLEDNLNTSLGEFGSKISGGQQQRIGLARAIYKNPEVIILDEGLSNVDQKTRESILNKLIDLKKKKTIIYISHDLDDLKKCDDILKLQ
ncbi:MAG: hypothetical protein CMG39_00080 [Candidatus Marinimicrobia bacterium]|nr:hypothetical protein [Candidatus Neomarinimicrobiota bacterium]